MASVHSLDIGFALRADLPALPILEEDGGATSMLPHKDDQDHPILFCAVLFAGYV
jgi:hypothetical protein